MCRIAGIVAVGYPHHVTQRGNNKQAVFSTDRDRRKYLEMLAEYWKYTGISPVKWLEYLCAESEAEGKEIRKHTLTGKPLAERKVLLEMEALTGRVLGYRPVGRPKKERE